MKAVALRLGLVGMVAGLLTACDLSADDKKVLSNSTDRFGQHGTDVMREVGPPSRRVSQAGDDVLTCHKTRAVFERYNIVSECDLVEAAKKLNALHSTVRLKPDTTYDADGYDADGHNLGTATRQSKSRHE